MSTICPHCGGKKDNDAPSCSACAALFEGKPAPAKPEEKARPKYDDLPELLKRKDPILPPLPPITEKERRRAPGGCSTLVVICFMLSLGIICLYRVIC